MTTPKISVEAFGPKLLQAILKAATERVELVCENERMAIRLKQRFNQLRSRMKATNHESYPIAQRVTITIKKEKPSVVLLYPRDSEFDNVFDSAGIQMTQLDHDPLFDTGSVLDEFKEKEK